MKVHVFAYSVIAMLFGLLMIVMLTVSQVKHVKWFGFDAETWDQKQMEPAQPVDQVQELAKERGNQP